MISVRDLTVIRRLLDANHGVREVVLEWRGLRVETSIRDPGEPSIEQMASSRLLERTAGAPGEPTAVRAPVTGRITLLCETGARLTSGEPLARIISGEEPFTVRAPFAGFVATFFQSQGAFVECDAIICLFEGLCSSD